MAYVDSHRKERFSLLLLEPSEIYFEDYSVFCYPANFSEEEAIKRKQKGRLKICSKSLVFDPKDINKPILKFQLSECTIIDQWNGSLLSKLDTKGNVIRVVSEQVVEIEGGIIAPYRFKREKQAYLFTLNYVSASYCLPQILQLRRAATLPGVEQASMIAAIVMSRQSRVSFDTSWLEDLYETIILETTGNRITPLVTNPGRILLTSSRIYFQPYNNAEPWPVLKFCLSDIKRVVKRRFLLRHVGIELYCSNKSPIKHLFLTLKSHEERETLYSKLLQQPALNLEDTATDSMTLLWQNGTISNYDYLLYINSMADRSFNDLTQYPIFPWVISNYSSSTLDISDPESYRDLSKPIGALNEDRLQKLMERYEEMSEPKFMYGSHYSTPGFVLYYLVRQMPEYMLCLQNGKFDHPDRMFNSIPDTWRNVTTNTSDFKELIPEFYEPENKGAFLVNHQNLDFGCRQDGTKVKDVELPNWAKDPEDFIIKLRNALESDIVSENIHHWIDLMFGYKQRGEEAIKAKNVFYYLTYEGAIDLDNIKDINERYSLEVQIMEFGQTPKQIFIHPHPKRKLLTIIHDRLSTNPYPSETRDNIQLNQATDDKLSAKHKKSGLHNFHWNRNMESLTIIAEYKLHKEEVTDVTISSDGKNIFSVSQDSLLKMYSLEDKRQLRSINISNMALSSCYLMNDDKTMIISSWDNFIYTYNISYGKIISSTMAHNDAVTDISWNCGILATASWDATAKIWQYNQQQCLRPYNCNELLAELDHETGVTCVDLSSDNLLLVSGTSEGHISFWNLQTFTLIGQFSMHIGIIYAVSFSPDGEKVASCGKDQTLNVMDVKTGTQLLSKNAGEELRCLCWDGLIVLTGSESGKIMVWDLMTAKLVTAISGHSGPVTCLSVSKEGDLVVSGSEDRKVIVWHSKQL